MHMETACNPRVDADKGLWHNRQQEPLSSIVAIARTQHLAWKRSSSLRKTSQRILVANLRVTCYARQMTATVHRFVILAQKEIAHNFVTRASSYGKA